jgi:hypothetical protein
VADGGLDAHLHSHGDGDDDDGGGMLVVVDRRAARLGRWGIVRG